MFAFDYADPPCNALRGQAIVSGHHNYTDPGAVTLLHGVRHIGTRRVDHGDQPQKGEIPLHQFGCIFTQVDGQRRVPGKAAGSHGQHAQTVTRIFVVNSHSSAEILFRHGNGCSAVLPAGTKFQNLFGRTFDVRDP